jgi:hypothetical protein
MGRRGKTVDIFLSTESLRILEKYRRSPFDDTEQLMINMDKELTKLETKAAKGKPRD